MEPKVTVEEIPLDLIVADGTTRDPGRDLVHSLRRCGRILIPISVRRLPDGRFQLVDGSRRVAAARELGWPALAGFVKTADDTDLSKDLEAIEINRQRANLRLQHVALHARQALAASGYSQRELATQIQMSESLLSSLLKVYDCADLVAAMDNEGLEFGAARALVGLPPGDRRAALEELRAVKAATGRFPTVREVETLVRRREGHVDLSPFTPESAPEAVLELVTRGVSCDIKVVHGRHTRLGITLTVSDDDEEWIHDLLAGLEARGE